MLTAKQASQNANEYNSKDEIVLNEILHEIEKLSNEGKYVYIMNGLICDTVVEKLNNLGYKVDHRIRNAFTSCPSLCMVISWEKINE